MDLTNFKTAIDIISAAKDASKLTRHARNLIVHGGKDYFGEVKVRDQHYRLWKIKIRATGNRGRYLKFRLSGDNSQKFRASADAYKPKKYFSISPEEWNVFACLAEDPNNLTLQSYAQNIVNQLVTRL